MENGLGMYCISVHPTRVNLYYDPLTQPGNHHKPPLSYEKTDQLATEADASDNSVASKLPEQFRDNYHHGKISKTAERKITRAIDYLVYLAKPKRLPHTKHGKGLSFRLNFVTLTLSSEQIHSDHEISYRVFHPFLVSLTREFKISNYIWRAERQSSGGIHYHLVTDRFIPWQRLRELWNRSQQHLGYVSRYRENRLQYHSSGFRYDPFDGKKRNVQKQKKAYDFGVRTDWEQPNSTDVHSLRFIIYVQDYFKKYMTKEGQNSNISGRLWGCSMQLTGIKGGQAAVYSSISDDLAKLESDKSLKVFKGDYYTTIMLTPEILMRLGCHEILNIFFGYLCSRWKDFHPPLRFAA